MKPLWIALFMCCTSVGILSAQDWNLTGAGARAEGLGGAFIGVADDATAIVWNPAGLVQLERAEASVVTRFISEKADYTYTSAPASNTSLTQSHVVFNFGSFALPFKLGSTAVVVAAAYQRQIDLYSNVKMSGGESEAKGGVDTFTPGISVRVSPLISVGVSANIWNGSYDVTGKSTTYSGTTNSTDNLKFKGFNLVIGGMADLEALQQPVPLKFGITIRTPFDLTAEGSQNASGPGYSRAYTENGSIQMPLMIGFGTSYRFSENFTVAADYEIRSYGDKEYTDEMTGYGATQKTTNPMSDSKENLNQFRVGAEYLIVSKNAAVPIRIGYRTVPTLSANYDQKGASSGQVVGKAITLGSGYIDNAFAIDVAYTMTDYTQTYTGTGTIAYSFGTLGASAIIYF
jgi:long-subunit fatty acid transport protein